MFFDNRGKPGANGVITAVSTNHLDTGLPSARINIISTTILPLHTLSIGRSDTDWSHFSVIRMLTMV